MSDVAIRADELSKQYRLGRRESYRMLRDAITDVASAAFLWARSFARTGSKAHETSEVFDALRDVSFEVRPGTVVGVIGRNGAGKSTLLKILSRITEPSGGRVEIHGRVGSLLEVGTGFHPELTGRENIFLNGAILGMRRNEVTRKFDEIVAFAELDRFIDTPVKRYSSGMYMRLAFSVAAHLDPEVLLVDEVLAVGDASFQQKCLGKMGDVATEGRTVLLVSHNMAAVERLCAEVLWLDRGRLSRAGPAGAVIANYLESSADGRHARQLDERTADRSPRHPVIVGCKLGDEASGLHHTRRMGDGLSVAVSFRSPRALRPIVGIVIKTGSGTPLFGVNNRFIQAAKSSIRTCGTVRVDFASLPLMPGRYLLDLYLGDETGDYDRVTEAISFDVVEGDVFGTGKIPPSSAGPIFWQARFTTLEQEAILSDPVASLTAR